MCKDRQTTFGPTGALPVFVNCIVYKEVFLINIHPVRHAEHPKQILQAKHKFTTKLRGRPFDSAGEGGGGWQFISSQNIYFQSFAGDNGCRIINLFIFLGTQVIIFIIRCLTAKTFILKILPPPPINCTTPNQKKGPVSTIPQKYRLPK